MASSGSHDQTPSPESVLNPNYWDVFINFRGQDTRYTFTDHLYIALTDLNVKTFRDTPDLPTGRAIKAQLMQSIQKAKTYIVVFSQNYASSHWCLDELVEIIRCCKTVNRSVIPVYYHIDPSVVRYQTDEFKTAFEKHEKRYEQVRLKNWRTALEEMAGISGYPVGKNTYEGAMLKEIVERILYELDPKTLRMPDYSVGLESRLKDMTAELNRSKKAEKGVIKFGIHGMAGVGKTTLAKAFYNKNFHLFEGSSFLKDVKEASSKEQDLVRLQQQLIDNVCKCENKKIDNFDVGAQVLKERIAKIKVLIVVDDLVEGKALEFVKGPFAEGSIIIITTRNEDLLDLIGVQPRYKVNELDYDESLQIFSYHIFKGNKIPEKFTEWSKQILVQAGGLPLALCTFGLKLAGNKLAGNKHIIRACKSFLERMERRSIHEVEKELLISYNDLELPDQKDIFLDIACFFVGREEQEVVQIMKTYYKSSINKINNMKQRSLISIKDRDNLLGMHPLFQHMGRKLVLKRDPPEPAKTRCRLWLSKDIRDVLGNKTGTEAILGVVPENQNALCSENSYTLDTFIKMSNLRFLHIENKNFNADDFGMALKDLTWLCWGRFPSECLSSKFFLENIKMLEFPHSEIITIWQPSKNFSNLKTLSMKCSEKLTTTPDFENLQGLKTLNFKGCKSLEVVHPSIKGLVKLVSLNLGDCVNLRSLPNIICKLTSLEKLDLTHCNQLKSIPKLPPNVKWVNANDCKSLAILAGGVFNLKQLEYLYLTNCTSLTEIQGAEGLTSLREIHLGGCNSSLLACTLTEGFFQTGSGHQTQIFIPAGQFPNWISELSSCTGQSSNAEGTTMSIDLSPNFLTMILSFEHSRDRNYDLTTYSIKNIKSGFIWSGSFDNHHNEEAQIVIVPSSIPSSIFSVTDDDNKIEFTTNSPIIKIYWRNTPEIFNMIEEGNDSASEENCSANEDITMFGDMFEEGNGSTNEDVNTIEEGNGSAKEINMIEFECNGSATIKINTNEEGKGSAYEENNMTKQGKFSTNEVHTTEEGKGNANEEINTIGEGSNSVNEKINTTEEGNGSGNQEINTEDVNGSATVKIDRIEVGNISVNKEIDTIEDSNSSANEEIDMIEDGNNRANKKTNTIEEGNGSAIQETYTIEHVNASATNKINRIEVSNISANEVIHINQESNRGANYQEIERIEASNDSGNQELDRIEEGVTPELLLENKDGWKRTKWYTPCLKLMCIWDS